MNKDAPIRLRLAPKRPGYIPKRRWTATWCLLGGLVAGISWANQAEVADAPSDPPAKPATQNNDDSQQTPSPEPITPPTVIILEGQVTNHIGGGHKDVKITLARKNADGSPGDVVIEFTTDELGDFSVSREQPLHGDFVVTFIVEQYKPLVREVHLGDDQFPPYLAETLEGKLAVVGRVIDALSKKPIPEASVTLKAFYREWYADADEEGRFTIEGVVPGSGELIVEADHYGREQFKITQLEDFGEIVARLKPERIVTLFTVDGSGKPIAGVTIETMDDNRDDYRSGVTDSTGKLSLHGIHFDTDTLKARLTHDQFVSDSQFDRTLTLPEDRQQSTHRITLFRAGLLTGRVLDERGRPLNGVRVMTGETYNDDSPRDWTDHEGRYTITGVEPGDMVVTVHLFDYAPDLRTVTIKPGKTSTLDFKLHPATVLQGVVKNTDDEPISGAYVNTALWRDHETLGLRTVSETDGTFVIENVPRDEFTLVVSARGYTPAVDIVARAGSDEPLIIKLEEAAGGDGGSTLKNGDTAPVLTLTTLDGQTINLANLRGKTILLDFWATWCGPCVAELPHLIEVYEKFGARKDFVIIGISLDGDENALRSFLKRKKMKWTQVMGDENGTASAMKRYGVQGIPAMFLIDPLGKIRGVNVPGSLLKKKVKRLLDDYDPL